MNRYVCIHGHFYQPPREHPWLETIELQDSAHPYHDWNEKISAECYAPNTAARILGERERIVNIVNNYERISFNFGPTLLTWLEQHQPDVYESILEADRKSQKRYSGHGSALAQSYNHTILPLSSRRDQQTQIFWGIADFKRRFSRDPEGLWLPETAVSTETLEILAEQGIRFTILAPRQAGRFRRSGEGEWRSVSATPIDVTRPYRIPLPSGRSIAVFFYDGATAQAVAFEGLLARGENLAHRLTQELAGDNHGPRLIHIATDGETYGHHHRYGEMALAYALHYIESRALARITNYGEYLELFPPEYEVEIAENSSWSCAHGVERWRADCGCSTGQHPDWNQRWRGPLRKALETLDARLTEGFEQQGARLFHDPWKARDNYISVMLDRSPESVDVFLRENARHPLEPAETVQALQLLELQRHSQLMFTSCGWFFDDLARIEAIQILRYAARAIQLAEECFGDDIEETFLQVLEDARSNTPGNESGRALYERAVRPSVVNLEKVGAHYGISSLFERYPERVSVAGYDVSSEDEQVWEVGQARLKIGRVRITSGITRISRLLSYGVLHLGDHNVNCGVREYQGEVTYLALIEEIEKPFQQADFAEIIRLLDKHFGTSTYSLKSLFLDEQRKIVDLLLESTLEEVESSYRQIYSHHASLMRFLGTLGAPMPGAFRTTAEFVLNANLQRALEESPADTDRIQTVLETAQTEGIQVNYVTAGYALSRAATRLARELKGSPEDLEIFDQLSALVSLARSFPSTVDLWQVQNIVFGLRETALAVCRAREGAEARRCEDSFQELAKKLHLVIS